MSVISVHHCSGLLVIAFKEALPAHISSIPILKFPFLIFPFPLANVNQELWGYESWWNQVPQYWVPLPSLRLTSPSKTLLPFLSRPFPLRCEEYQRKEGTENEQDSLGNLPGAISPLCPQFLVCRKRLSCPRPTPRSKEQTQAVNAYNYRVTPLLVPPERIEITIWPISLSCSAETKTTARVEDGDHMLTTSTRSQAGWNQKADDWDSPKHHPVASPPTNQKKVQELIRHPRTLSPTLSLKTLPWKPSGSSGPLSMSCPFSLLGNCNKRCTFFRHFPGSVDWLYCTSGPQWTQVWFGNTGTPMFFYLRFRAVVWWNNLCVQNLGSS